jgi:hypothetical protein
LEVYCANIQPKLNKLRSFTKKMSFLMGFGGLFEVHSILAKYYRINSTDLFVKHFFGFFDTLGTPVGVQLSHG